MRRSHRVDFLTNRLRAGTYIPTYQNFDAGIRNTCNVSGCPRPRPRFDRNIKNFIAAIALAAADWISSFLCLDSATRLRTVCWSGVGQSMTVLVLFIINDLKEKQRFSRPVPSTARPPIRLLVGHEPAGELGVRPFGAVGNHLRHVGQRQPREREIRIGQIGPP